MTKVETGMSVIVARLLPEDELDFSSAYLAHRQLHASGLLRAWFGRDRRRVWVDHGQGQMAAYFACELEPLH
ncbi:MAG: hypothetical protein K2Y32_16215 [Candidatus Obscuribacterales bacterium]|nr:hypothetical protein [Candidatus Obscuribacterales bacterium]